MNYRHAYHAGNFADVLKHVVLMLVLEHLQRKEAPYFFLDTHAGRGRYLLDSPETAKGGEFREGILRLRDWVNPPPAIVRFLELVRELGEEHGRLLAYPGSPRLAAALLRPQDRAVCTELERGEASALREEFRGDERIAVHQRDGYEALKAFLPPRERRGLVLVDPPYETQAAEFETLRASVPAALERWPTGMFAVWYPIKFGATVPRFHAAMAASGLRRQLIAELCIHPVDTRVGLNGAGMLLINPPFQLDEELRLLLPAMHRILAPAGRGGTRVTWLVGE
jgi:23S rRNA (adenine2030-N6)-methyltransferase